MECACDLHIHTAASPCGDEWMTPNNIVNMSLLKGLQLIAITDHQTTANCQAVMEVAEGTGLIVIPGMEIECMEEFHLIALFKNIQSARSMEAWLAPTLPKVANRTEIFGHQVIFNSQDEVVGEIDQLLLTASQMSVEVIVKQVLGLGGVIYPAHIDRGSYSIISNLGSVPEDLPFKCLEISKKANKKLYEEKYEKYTIIQSSDAHYLEDIAEKKQTMEWLKLEQSGIYVKSKEDI